MDADTLLSPCPACNTAALAAVGNTYQCVNCSLGVKEKKKFLRFRSNENRYLVQSMGDDFSLVREGMIGHTFSLAELEYFRESVYADHDLADFAEGNYDALNMPGSALAQILLEQLRETCYIQINALRRAHGPVLAGGGDRFPKGKAPTAGLIWQDKGNLFFTNIRLVFPSDTFTFIRLDRRLVGVRAFENALAIQRKGEDFATYFVGLRPHQAVLTAAYILGKAPQLRS